MPFPRIAATLAARSVTATEIPCYRRLASAYSSSRSFSSTSGAVTVGTKRSRRCPTLAPRSHSHATLLTTPGVVPASSFSSSAAYDTYEDDEESTSISSAHDYSHGHSHSHHHHHQQHDDSRSGYQHCDTCTCDTPQSRQTQHQCEIPPSTLTEELPPPLPEPKYSFHKRLMPSNLTALSSRAGRRRFLEALSSDNAEAYLPLAEQFLNQSDPAYCGITTLAMILNACAVDPNVRWRGGWRWYGSDDVVLDRCCLGSEHGRERVRRAGITLEEFAGLGRCQGMRIDMKRPYLDKVDGDNATASSYGTLDDFRSDIQRMVQLPPISDEDIDGNTVGDPNDEESRGFLVVSFSRAHLNQTGAGHFSPVAAYHPPTDSCLVLDVARFKYAPYWVSVEELYEATKPLDETTGKSRGWFVMRPPRVQLDAVNGYQGINKRDEGMRPADSVPLVGEDEKACVHNTTSSSHKETCPVAYSR